MGLTYIQLPKELTWSMKKSDLKRHLKDYSIYGMRSSTISHAFASALSIADKYDEVKVDKAISILGQNPDSDLFCAYCDKPAETWDHVKAIVVKTTFSGYGHQINNLIPCCKNCNSAKGNKDWIEYLRFKRLDTKERIDRIESYINNNFLDTKNLLQTEEFKEDLKAFNEIKDQVFELFKMADELAKSIRGKISQASKPIR